MFASLLGISLVIVVLFIAAESSFKHLKTNNDE